MSRQPDQQNSKNSTCISSFRFNMSPIEDLNNLNDLNISNEDELNNTKERILKKSKIDHN